jgi:methionyl-tRNA formyltransferase
MHTGISIMRMDAGLDTGPVFARRPIDILPDDDAGTLHDRLAELGAELIVDVLERMPDLRPEPQPQEGVTYAAKITKEETIIDWARPAAEIARMVRAFRPSPGAVTQLDGTLIKIWRAQEVQESGPPGMVLSTSGGALTVACGAQALAITEAQRSGGKRLSASELLRGHPLAPGVRFG